MIDEGEIIKLLNDKKVIQLFIKIKLLNKKELNIYEKINLIETMIKFKSSTEILYYAYEISTVKTPNYINAIIRSWYDKNLFELDDIKKIIILNKENKNINLIEKELGIFKASIIDKKIIADWINIFNIDIILYACSKSKNTSNPNINYINGIIQNWNKEKLRSLNDIKNYEQKFYKRKISKN